MMARRLVAREQQRLHQLGHPRRVPIGDVRGQAARQRVVAPGVSEGVAGDLEELRSLRVAQAVQIGARQDLPGAIFGESRAGGLGEKGGEEQRMHGRRR